jgi:hypothetical protein
MITISNKQRDDIVRYLDLLCQTLEGDSTRIFNTKRLASKLSKTLESKQPVRASELSEQLNFSRKTK